VGVHFPQDGPQAQLRKKIESTDPRKGPFWGFRGNGKKKIRTDLCKKCAKKGVKRVRKKNSAITLRGKRGFRKRKRGASQGGRGRVVKFNQNAPLLRRLRQGRVYFRDGTHGEREWGGALGRGKGEENKEKREKPPRTRFGFAINSAAPCASRMGGPPYIWSLSRRREKKKKNIRVTANASSAGKAKGNQNQMKGQRGLLGQPAAAHLKRGRKGAVVKQGPKARGVAAGGKEGGKKKKKRDPQLGRNRGARWRGGKGCGWKGATHPP